ncbi:mastermind-like protein 2 [Puntigrus tetrazona]|uniref:mastermind-like protein 2 n=1 Tax=Puntigrus tetrazona TaxID=1606681 RepID=UPI001C8A6758|nr:mastermind-like protein 2 [Puntigrus tetrazona]XP_043115135.1 mastermind-like protein 2 [Puntigrus tetrazona]XP_043115136.1 mastermind-like protein 2 [Puntigrus tetrazona]
MGEAAPTQATPSGFAPMLGVGMGGSVTPIATSRGSAVPQLHSAIVERLRARIELCRRHHSTCEDRYVRGQAESSDREHESTLHLLNIVHQGPGNRKTKGNRAASQQPPEYSRVNGEHKAHGSSEADSKISSQIAQGLRRKIEAQTPGYTSKQNGLSCGASGSDFKRLRMETSSFRSGSCALASGQTHRLVGDATQGNILRRKDTFMMPHGVSSDLFNITLRDMKKEPIEVQTCSQSSTDTSTLTFDFKDEVTGQIDPELQDLFDELTKTVPSLNDLELEKMLKQDDDFGLDLGRPNSAGAAPPCIHLDKPIKTEYSPDYNQVTGSSPQLRPASAGPSFSMANNSLSTSPITSGHHVQVATGGPSRGLPAWPEMSHAEQLKQMAANQQQPNSMLHNHQQSQAGGVRNWSTALGVHQTPGSFSQETLPGNASLSQQRLNAQSTAQAKGMPNCFLKPNEFNPSHHMDTKVLSTKPLLHFSPKAPPSTMSQQMPIMAAPQNKTTMQQQPSTAGQGMHFQNCQLPMQPSTCLQTKPLGQRPPLNQHGAGISFKMAQQRQGISPGPRLPVNGRPVDVTGQTQQLRPPVLSSQQKNPGQDQNLQRPLGQPQLNISDTEKLNTQDQFSRHLTRPPPDYKQPRNGVGSQQPSLYTGNGSDQSDIQPLSCHLPNGQGTKMVATSGERRFPLGQDRNSGPTGAQVCANQHRPQPSSLIRMGLQQNKPQFHGTNNQSATFQSSTQHVRTSVSQDSLLGQRLGDVINTSRMDAALNWANSNKPSRTPTGLDVKRFPNTVMPQSDIHFPPRSICPPNQVAPHSSLLPINPAIRSSAPRASQPRIPPLPGVTCLTQSSTEQPGCPTTFGELSQSPATYQNNRAGRLTFDFLPEDDNTVPGINADSDFIDSLLKSGSGNDDWMKDINLEEILGGHS